MKRESSSGGCIQQYREKSNRCPKCRAVVSGSNPLIPNYTVMSIIESMKGKAPTSLKSKRTKGVKTNKPIDTENKDNDDSSTTAVYEDSSPRPVNKVEDLGRDAIRRMTNGVGNFGLDNDTTSATEISLSFDPMAAAEAAFHQDFGGFNTTTDNPSDEQSPTLAVLANAATETSTSMSRNTNTYTYGNGDNEGAAVSTDLTEASAPTRQSRGQQTSNSKSSWRSRSSESPLRGHFEATQRAQQNVMNGGTKRSFMSSMNNMNRTKSPGANFRLFYSGNNNSAARSFQPPSSSAYLMNRNTMTTRGVEALTKSRPDNKRQKTQPSEKSYSEEIKVFVDNLDLGES